MPELYLISTYQCGKLLDINKDLVRKLLDKKELDYVRDSERIFRISLESVLDYASNHKLPVDKLYLDDIRKKINPWREVAGKEMSADTPEQVRPKKKAKVLSPEMVSMGFTKRALTAFRKNGVYTIEQLTELKAVDLMKMNNFGRKTLVNVRAVLEKNGLSLKNSQ